MRLFLYIALVVSVFSCSKENGADNPDGSAGRYPAFSTYTIPKGEHYASNNSYKPFREKRVYFQAIFDSSAIYASSIGSNQSDINKLFGVSDGNTNHQQNSARFGWNWNGEELEIHAYCYANGSRSFKKIGVADIGKTYDYSISTDSSHYFFTFNSQQVSMQRAIRDSVLNGYTLYPYFGGDEPAPHEIRVYLKELNQ